MFKRTEDAGLLADSDGELTYAEAIESVIDDALDAFEEALWNMVDELEYLILAESEGDDDVSEGSSADEDPDF